MLVIAPTVILTEGAVDDPRLPLIGWRNAITIANIAADSALPTAPVTNLANPDTSERWTAAAIGARRLTFTTSSADDFDYIAFAGQNFAKAAISTTIECKFAPTDPDWTVLVAELLLADDRPALFRLPKQPYYQLSVALGAGTAAAEAAVLYAGLLTALDPGVDLPLTPLPFGYVSDVYVGRNVAGEYLGEIEATRFLQSSLSIKNMDSDWYRANLDPWLGGKRVPFFHAWDPAGHPFETGFCWLTNSPMPVIDQKNRRMSIALNISGVAKT